MKDESCICFLRWALPHLHGHWPGYRRVRGQVCKRLARRLEELQLPDLRDYRAFLEENPLEWHILDGMCRITISRFYRDRGVYRAIRSRVFPELLEHIKERGEKILSCWCIGAASGEEPYSLGLLWESAGMGKQGVDLRVLATEIDGSMINRARRGCYPASSIRELPATMKDRAFLRKDDLFCLKEPYRKGVQFLRQDIRNTQPDATFHLVLCRNLVFTYFSRELQDEIGRQILLRLKPGGGLVIGAHEALPQSLPALVPWLPERKIYRREA